MEARSICELLYFSLAHREAEETQDYAISIATIHHLSTYERRRSAVKVGLHRLYPYSQTEKPYSAF